MKLPVPFSFQNAPVWKRLIEQADAENYKRGRDIEVGEARVILTAPNGTRYKLVVDNSGALSTAAI